MLYFRSVLGYDLAAKCDGARGQYAGLFVPEKPLLGAVFRIVAR